MDCLFIPTSSCLWEYVCEGGQHVLFRYVHSKGQHSDNKESLRVITVRHNCLDKVPSSSSKHAAEEDMPLQQVYENGRSMFQDKLLRLSKQVFVFCEESSQTNEDDAWSHMVLQHLTPYIELPVTVVLPFDFILDLRHDVLERNVVPSCRLADWGNLPHSSYRQRLDTSTINSRCVKATLVPDYRLVAQPRSNLIQSTSMPIRYTDSITVEIKPKAGYITRSPLIHPKHRNIKWKMPRYEIVRRLKQTSSKSTDLVYNPLDFFAIATSNGSTSTGSMISALHALIVQSTPHFKIWLNDEKVLPPFPAFVSTVVPSSPLYDILQQPDEPKEMIMDPPSSLLSILCKDGRLLESLLSFILVSERTLLQQLVEMQMLDVLDADGAILVYDQLVLLCQGDHNKAQSLVESSLLTIDLLECSCKCSRSVSPDLECAPLDHLLRFSPYTFPRESVNLLALLTLMDDFQSWFQRIHDDMHHWDSDIDDKYLAHLDEFYKNACSLTSQLDIDDCVYLLQNWLLSLTMCDITMFLNIIPVSGNANAKLFPSTLTDSNEVEAMELARRQSTNASGSVIMRLGKGTSILWDYKINIIDWDRKPAKKLQDLRKREEPIQFLSA